MKKNIPKKKAFDVQWGDPKMPDDVKEMFFDMYDMKGNDVWVEYTIGQYSEWDDLPVGVYNLLDQWLLDNLNVKEGEEILMKHWW